MKGSAGSVLALLRALAARGADLNGGQRWAKGSTWVLRWDGDRCVEGRYLPPLEI